MAALIETARLWLRPLEFADEDALYAVFSDPVAMQWFPRVRTRDEVRAGIERNRQRFADDGTGLLALVLKNSGEVIGDCGPVLQDVDGRWELEVGYHLRRDYWNRGFATEAARACMEYAFESLGAETIISLIRPENLPSRRVAEKNGLTLEKVVRWRDYDHCVYRIARYKDLP
jgi:ribosomal-protein-alanine N-acetyltransferase